LSFLAGVLVFAWLELTIAKKLNNYVHIFLCLSALLATILLSKRVLGDSFTLANYLSLTQRKILAALFFAGLLIICGEIYKLILKRHEIQEDDALIRRTILYLISLCSAVQAWPFFDQMHIWWSFAPIVIVVADRFSRLTLLNSSFSRAVLLFTTAALMTFLVLSQFSGTKTELKSINQRFVFVDLSDEQDEADIQAFIQSEIPSGSRILNLCPNAYPFFVPGKFRTDSRFFVYWSNFENAPIDYRDYSSKQIRYVMICQTYLYQGAELAKYVSRQKAVIDSLGSFVMTSSRQIGSFNLEIYARKSR
jgi:hypothetical protein